MSQDLTPEIFALVDRLGADLKHDAKAASLLGELAKHIRSANATEERIQKKVGGEYVFAEAASEATVPTNYLEFLVSTLARVGMVYEMARKAGLSNDDVAYINTRLGEAQAGNFVADAAGVTIPSKWEIAERTVAESFGPIVDLAERVLKIETPKTNYKREQIEQLLVAKRASLASAETLIATFEPMVEEAFQRNIEEKLKVAEEALAAYQQTGEVPDGTEAFPMSPMFSTVEDQLLFNLECLRKAEQRGSPERQAVERAAEEVINLRGEIQEIERSLAPIVRKVFPQD